MSARYAMPRLTLPAPRIPAPANDTTPLPPWQDWFALRARMDAQADAARCHALAHAWADRPPLPVGGGLPLGA